MRFRIAITLLICGLNCGISAEVTVAPGLLVEQLDHDSFPVRQRAMANLLEIGEAAIDELEALGDGASAEQRFRVKELLGEIYRRRLEQGFGELGRCPDQDVDVEQGMILIAQILDPKVEPQSITEQLDEMADAVRRSLGEGVDPKTLGGAEAVQAITGVLRDQYQLKGDENAYDHPDNSSIHRVLEQRDGLPILLSEIAVAVGKRLGVPLVGLGVPGRYMFMYDGSQAPAGESDQNIIVDAFGGWEVKQNGDLFPGWLHPAGGEIQPSLPRETLIRMLRNMGSDFLFLGSERQCELLRRYEALVEGAGTDRAR